MIEERAALNIEPGDEIDIDGNWWLVIDHSFTASDPAPVKMRLISRDREFLTTIITCIGQQFRCEPHVC